MNWALLATWAGVAITGGISIYNLRANRAKTLADTDHSKVETALKSRQAAAFDEDRENEREAKWQRKLDDCEDKFQAELAPLRAEVAMLKRYIERHVPWDWRAVRELRLQGVEIEDPPTLVYVPLDNE